MTVLGVSLKAYLGAQDTRAWLADVAALADDARDVELFVLPPFPLLESASRLLDGTGIGYGAQDVAWADDGPWTGEVTAAVLAELGCRYAEVGHAERRRWFGEDDDVVAAKAAAAVRHGLVPVVCVGEIDHLAADDAIAWCERQVRAVLASTGRARLVVAYEPVWAIGADHPAPVEHVRAVAAGLRSVLGHGHSLIYGGTAGPGLLADLGDAVDGLFLGRRAHDVTALRAVLQETSRS